MIVIKRARGIKALKKEGIFTSISFTANHINYKETFSDNNKKVKENIIMWNNFYKLANEWLISINEKFNVFLNSIQQYISLQPP